MIESGLALCAACLPASYSLVRSKGLQEIVRSVQSILSLRSLSSHGSGRGSRERGSRLKSQPSEDPIVTHAEGPARNDGDIEMALPQREDGIVVTQSFDASERRV